MSLTFHSCINQRGRPAAGTWHRPHHLDGETDQLLRSEVGPACAWTNVQSHLGDAEIVTGGIGDHRFHYRHIEADMMESGPIFCQEIGPDALARLWLDQLQRDNS
jgi:hypothetical protein